MADRGFARLADQHEQRRRDGLPTVSTIVGPVHLSQQLWRAWRADRHCIDAPAVGGCRRGWRQRWLATLLDHRDLYADAEAFLTDRLRQRGVDVCVPLDQKTSRELTLIFERAQLSNSGLEPGRLCRWLLLRRSRGDSLSSCDIACRQASWLELVAATEADAFRQVVGLLTPESTPSISAVLPAALREPTRRESGNDFRELAILAENLVQLATRVPELTVALAIEESSWEEYVQLAPENFTKAILREHVIRLAQLNLAQFSDVPASDSVAAQALAGSAPSVQAGAVTAPPTPAVPAAPTETLFESITGERTDVSKASERFLEEADPWKSEAERFFFRLLEGTPDLSGLFQLNVNPGFAFGNRPAEVDLACLALKIAVEIDGYYHFQDADNYRSDRRKDLELQRHGFLVLRFLADDVVRDMKRVLQMVRAAVKYRKAQIRSHAQT